MVQSKARASRHLGLNGPKCTLIDDVDNCVLFICTPQDSSFFGKYTRSAFFFEQIKKCFFYLTGPTMDGNRDVDRQE